MFELQRYYSWVVDRFHLSTQAYQLLTYGKCPDFGWLEERLLLQTVRPTCVTRSPDSFARAREERLKVSGNSRQFHDLELFTREQELLQKLVSQSRLPCLWVDISDNQLDAAVERVVAWMETTGGLSMPAGCGLCSSH